MGVTKTQSSRWQKLAGIPEEKFEIRVEHAKARVAGMAERGERAQGGGDLPGCHSAAALTEDGERER